ncbi:non-ribosomal peptide synthetase domain protein [Pseudonocardia dioxanivorans CB1190]|uniref:Non-ribosomal peptide synthetase domain protein n=1 Tax=Pseudonocardia dioxanivorans (strain ATCC 55486 / DSM 44775 / JCM 13855 / CB1190) TaxID=675635 RepID=F4CLY7_PSEUX|nr:Pls/PosA family non-ribosomal peptide synthetase [Pseudonocardia dioxanivorans]AEA22335.1 non-ribosomal peptide synthetase domain protein [Pseudonocardia dioxanivorans CB1190]
MSGLVGERYGPAIFAASRPAPPRTLLDILDATTWACPDAAALDDGNVRLDYRGLQAEVTAAARTLRAAGIGPGDRVGIRIPSGTAGLYVAILAILAAGACYVPVDADDPPERAELVFTEAAVTAVLDNGEALRVCRPPRGVRRPTTPDDDAWIIFTSGSTGVPKGVVVTHRSAAAFVDAEAQLFLRHRPIGPGDRVLAGLSVGFDASCEEMWLAWRHGACLVPAPRAVIRTGADLGPWLVERGVTVVSTVPTLASLWPIETLAAVRLLILGGEACPGELAARLAAPGREVWNTYGPTEATVVATAAELTGDGEVRIGTPLAGWLAAVVDPTGQPVSWGDAGELVLGGVGLARYLDQDRDAQRYAALPALGWRRAYRTGDLVRADPAGLVFVGRVDDQVKIGGRRVELGEIDAALHAVPGVVAAAAAVRSGPSGLPVLVGYVVPSPGFDLAGAQRDLADRLPAPLVPRLAVLAELPSRSSGKVDRAALPWPLPEDPGTGARPDGTAGWLADRWTELLGSPVTGTGQDFFAAGGSSLAAASLVSVLRARFPGVSVADVYRYPTLGGLAARLDELGGGAVATGRVRPVPRRAAAVQLAVLALSFAVTGVRWVVVLGFAADLVDVATSGAWAPHTSWWFVTIGGGLLLTPPGRFAITVAAVRALCRGVRPGDHPRGGRVHLRLWAAERVAALFGIAALSGTPWAGRYARALGCQVGRDVVLHTRPPVTGLARLGDGAVLEPEVDIAGWWLDGDVLRVGAITIGRGARVGARSSVAPGVDIGDDAEVAPGSGVDVDVPAGQRWAGAPARQTGRSGEDWPAPRGGPRSRRYDLAYAGALVALPLLSVVAALPAAALTYLLLGLVGTGEAVPLLLATAPVAALLTFACYALLVALVVRVAGRAIVVGDHHADGRVGFAVWLVERLVDQSRSALFPLYASLLTPAWLRLLGARVGRRVEASTMTGLPGLVRVGDGGFLADDSLLAPHAQRGGWLRMGAAAVGERAFVGNSAIVGPGRAVPDGGLVGVLSETPPDPPIGSSWLGRPAIELPRRPGQADPARTYAPPRRLVLARAAVEAMRLVPVTTSLVLAEGVAGALGEVRLTYGLPAAVTVSGALLLFAGILACLLTTAAKWLLLGRIRPGEHPLWSSFVWRNELVDTFVEELAVPWLAGAAVGTPLLGAWLRTMGATVGRGVWCETWWLPEYDLVELGEGASVNRGCVVQTHLFHDRVMRLDRVALQAGATLGPHSIALPAAVLGEAASVGQLSLVMRGEHVPAGGRWSGNPIAGAPDPMPPRPYRVGPRHAAPRSRPLHAAERRTRSQIQTGPEIVRIDPRERSTPEV